MPSLDAFGLSPLQERLYKHLVRRPDATTEETAEVLGSSVEDITVNLHELLRLGVALEIDGAWSALCPQDAVRVLAERRIHWLSDQFVEVVRASTTGDALAASLGVDQSSGRIERLPTIEDWRDRVDDLAFFARSEVAAIYTKPELSLESQKRCLPLDMRCIRRGIRLRTVITRRAACHEFTYNYFAGLAEAGAHIRVVEHTDERLMLFDRQVAVVPRDPTNHDQGALVLREPAVVEKMLALYENIWDAGEPIIGSTTREDTLLTSQERAVLEMMCQASKDENGAKELDVSVRTYRRGIADVLRKLGAVNRSQAALIARERGLV